MGSYDAAVMTGFICRLCSELNRNVIHIYSDKGIDLQLAEKINLMPISVEPQDSLPKTICRSCIEQLDSQYRLIQQLTRTREKFLEHARRRRAEQGEEESEIEDCSSSSSSSSGSSGSSSSNATQIMLDCIEENININCD